MFSVVKLTSVGDKTPMDPQAFEVMKGPFRGTPILLSSQGPHSVSYATGCFVFWKFRRVCLHSNVYHREPFFGERYVLRMKPQQAQTC